MIKTVAVHEFMSTIKRKAYYLVTLGMPLILLAYAGLVALITYASVPGEMKRMGQAIGIVDESGILTGPSGALHDLGSGETFELRIPLDEVEGMGSLGSLDLEQFDLPLTKRRLRRFDDLTSAHEALPSGSTMGWYTPAPSRSASPTARHPTLWLASHSA